MIKDVKCPVLIIHGTKDSVIPYRHGKELFELANEPKRLVAVEGGDHNTLVNDMGFANYLKVIKDFVDGAGNSAPEKGTL